MEVWYVICWHFNQNNNYNFISFQMKVNHEFLQSWCALVQTPNPFRYPSDFSQRFLPPYQTTGQWMDLCHHSCCGSCQSKKNTRTHVWDVHIMCNEYCPVKCLFSQLSTAFLRSLAPPNSTYRSYLRSVACISASLMAATGVNFNLTLYDSLAL